MTNVLRRDRRGEDTGRREGRVKTEAEIGVMQPQAKDCQQPPEAGGSKDSPLEAWQEQGSADTLISDLWFPEL